MRRRRTTRTAVGIATATTMALTTVGTAHAAPSVAGARQATDATVGLVTEINRAELLLGELGLSLIDFADAEQKSPDFLAELDRLLDEREAAPEPEPGPAPVVVTPPVLGQHLEGGPILPGPTSASAAPVLPPAPAAAADESRRALLSQWLAHAYAMAELNSARDRDARDIGRETVYMYLSHYVDLPQDPTLYPVDHNSHANRYAAWITSDDRLVFDQYLRYDRHVELAYQITQLGEALRDLAAVPGAAVDAWQNATAWIDRILGAREVLDETEQTLGDLRQTIDALLDAWNAGDDPRAVIETVELGLAGSSYDEAWSHAVESLLLGGAATVGGGPAGVVTSIVTAALTVSLAGMRDVIDQAMLAGLLATATSRVTLRYSRSIGMD